MTNDERDIKETFLLGDISVGDIKVTGHSWVGHCQRDIFVVTRSELLGLSLISRARHQWNQDIYGRISKTHQSEVGEHM